jgi:methionine-S-sulfoxide reductase
MTAATERAVLAGGCFWGMQDLIRRMPGVISTRVGYTGGDVPNATYRNHGSHAEAIEITFDPQKVDYRDLLEFFFQIHDPTTRNRQGNDMGASYRSAIFHTSDEQKRVAEDTIAGQSGHRSDARRRLLAGRAGAPGLSGACTERLHVPLRAAELEAAEARQCARRPQTAGIGGAPIKHPLFARSCRIIISLLTSVIERGADVRASPLRGQLMTLAV